jgi:sensor domain CHASE-containing protein
VLLWEELPQPLEQVIPMEQREHDLGIYMRTTQRSLSSIRSAKQIVVTGNASLPQATAPPLSLVPVL